MPPKSPAGEISSPYPYFTTGFDLMRRENFMIENLKIGVKKSAQEWMTEKILTEEDYERIEEKRLEWLMQSKQQRKGGKRQKSPERETEGGDILNPANIEHIAKHKKQTKEERLETIKQGRPDKKFGFKKDKMNPYASTNNADKRKNKNFMMMVHKRSVRERGKKSFVEKQRELKKRLVKGNKK
eukprot:sb/3471483/